MSAETVRASVDDVQFTLILTIGLVVAVIFVFLRDLRATVIPGVAVVFNAWSNSRDTRDLADRAIRFYGG